MTDKPKRKRSLFFDDPDDNPCPICGESYFRWGTPTSNGGVYFSTSGHGFLGKNEGLRARVCDICGNVQLFLKSMTRHK